MSPSVSIVIVTWNKREDILNLLDSLQSIASSEIKIIIVDNASTDGSVEAIRNHPLSVTLLENSENRGGTGGFNAGIRYAMNNLDQKYIWLLDNDAEVMPNTLQKLIAVMEADASIGIAGSCILHPEDRTLIVEAGGHVDERTATWKPNLRYQPYSNYKGTPPIDVDYVPVCSALIRKELFYVVGILDERFFLHWDDVDLGSTAREKGFRVVAVIDSIVLHSTEKGYSNAVLYYDVRNSLLFISKHLSLFQRILPIFRVCVRNLMAARLFGALGEKLLSWYLYQALDNFVSGRYGVAPQPSPRLKTTDNPQKYSSARLPNGRNFVLFAVGSHAEIRSAAYLIRSAVPATSITLAAPSDRIDSYRSCDAIDHFISYDLARDGLSGCVTVVLKLLRLRFDCAVSAGTGFIVPFAFFVRRHIVVAEEGRWIHESNICLNSLWKLPCVVLSGLALSLPYLLKCWLASRRISEQSPGSNGLRKI